MENPVHPEAVKARLEERLERLQKSKRTAPIVAVVERFFEIEGLSQGGLMAIELFTTIVPLMIIGFAYFSGFAENANVGTMFIRQLGLTSPLDEMVRSAFGTSAGIEGVWSVVGLASFLFWGIPMSITVAAMFARAWRRPSFSVGGQLGRGSLWFLVYLTTMILRERIGFAGDHAATTRALLLLVSLIPTWVFWSLSPVLLVRDGARGRRALVVAGLAGVIIDGIALPVASKVVFPMLLKGWEGFGPIGVSLTMMTWCGVVGIGWVVTACSGAILWERTASTATVLDAQVDDLDAAEPARGQLDPVDPE